MATLSAISTAPLHVQPMCIYIQLGRYTWDAAKSAANVAKHGVAVEAFDWAHALVTSDLRNDEPRLTALGPVGDRLFSLVFTVERRSIRVISFRKASNKEKKLYAEAP